MAPRRKQQQQQQQQHTTNIDDGFAHDPALIEASNSAAAAVIQAAAFHNDNDGGLHHHHHHHHLDSNSIVHNHGLGSNLDPAVVGMGLNDGSGGSGGTGADDDATKEAVAVAAAAAAAAVANVNGGGGNSQTLDISGGNLSHDGSSLLDVKDDLKTPVKRTAITHQQRKALREWFFSQEPRPSQAKSIIWFHDKFDRVISQAAISHSLHDRYKRLDFAVGAPSSTYRQRSAQWPELEAILFDYLQAIEKKKGKSAFPSAVSGEMLTKSAKIVWEQIPMYQNQNPPTFSNGWVSRFKGRYKTYKQYGDSAAIDIRSIQQLTNNYSPDNIYTMDETSLFWRRPPVVNYDSRDKSKITLVLSANASGTDKLPIWSIGRSKEYRSLQNVNLSAIDSHWRSNENAWLTGSIMEEWLRFFYEHVGSRNVILLMDNFSAHLQGLAECSPPSNIKVQFLPTNDLSIFQPLEKGVIEQFKLYYRKHWLDYMISCYGKGQNPLELVTMREALRWVVKAWDHDISPKNILSAFYEASILSTNTKQQQQQLQLQAQQQQQQQQQQQSQSQSQSLQRQKNSNSPANSLIIPPPSSSSTLITNPGSINSTQIYSPQLILEPSYAQLWQTQQLPDMIDLESFINFSNQENIGVEETDESEMLQAIINFHLGLSQVDDDDLDANVENNKISTEVQVDADSLLPSTAQVLSYLEVVMHYVERQPFTTRSQMRALEEIEVELENRIA